MINYSIDENIALLTFDMPGNANVLNRASIKALEENITKALNDENVKGIILTSAKRDFILGGDLNELYAATDAETVESLTTDLNRTLRTLETGGKPVVAAMNGTALGGGYEVCLASHHRIAVNSSKLQIGLPEVTLGLLPGAGGTQRLPRLVGIQASMPVLLQGRKMRPAQALKAGMIDAVVDQPEDLVPAAKKWINEVGKAVQPWDERGFEVPGGGIIGAKNTWLLAGVGGMVRKNTYGNYPAPEAILNCVYTGLQIGLDAALEVEARYFTKLVLSKEAKHMIRTLWFSMNKAKSGGARPAGIDPAPVKKLGILGAGMMGAGIAYVSAKAGIETVLKDISVENAQKGKDYSMRLLSKALEKGRTTKDKVQHTLNHIQPTDNPEDMKGCDLVIEAVFEDIDLKARVTRESEEVMDSDGVFASNTSTLPISQLANASERPEKFIGLHFFSPVDKMQLVEVIMGKETGDYALAKSIDYIRQIRKVPIVVNDSRGFYTSRIFKTFVMEGMQMLAEGVKPALIENGAKMAGMPVGPLAVTDEVSLGLLVHIFSQYEKAGIEVDGAPRDVVMKMVNELKRSGKKAGAGFYEYAEDGKKRLWKGLAEHFPIAEQQPDVEVVKKRILHLQALESWKCLEEGVLRTPQDGDIGSILGWGFPAYTGGSLSYLDFVGLPTFVAECNDFADQFGERFRPTENLISMAQNNQSVYPKTEKQKA